MNIYEKLGDFLLNIILVVIAGGIFATIEKEHLNTTIVYLVCIVVIVILLVGAFLLYRISKKSKKL
jgi:Na+/proline symporter